jgi:hypothetical protein
VLLISFGVVLQLSLLASSLLIEDAFARRQDIESFQARPPMQQGA